MKLPSLRLAPVIVAGALALLTACASTPQSRIEKNPAIYGDLSKSHKALASQGKITDGMTPEAVFIAWGKPHSVKTSSDRGKITETWIYSGSEPVYLHSASYGYGYHRYHGYYHPAYCYGPSVYYRSYVAGKVTFRNQRVVQWEVTGP